MKIPISNRLPAFGRKTRILVGFALILVAFFLLFDWNWLRRPLERYLMEPSGREVRIGELHVDPGFTLEPSVRLRDVYVENAPWAAKRPFLTAAEVSFSVSLASIWNGRPVISKLVLIDASVDMERQADGLRNWRLRNPDDRSPGRVTVMTLEAHRSRINFVNRAIDLEFAASAAPVDTPNAERDDKGPSARIAFEGRYQSHAFSGEALSGPLLSFRASGISFPLRGHFVSRRTRFEFDGFFTDIFDLGPMDAKVRLAGPSLALLHPYLRIRPPESRPYAVEAQVSQIREVYHFAQLAGKVGGTGIAGDVVYDRSAKRPLLKAAVQSDAATLDDLRPLLGMQAPSQGARGDPSGAGAAASNDRKFFPSRPLRLDAMRAIDVRASARLKKLAVTGSRTLENVRIDVNLSEGVFELKRIDVGFAGGRVTGSATLDGRQDVPSAQLVVEFSGLAIQRLVPALAAKSGSAGQFSGKLELSGRGTSMAAIVGHSVGSFAAALDRGRISNLADAKLGLNFGKVISVFLRGDRDIAINCAAAVFDVRDGIATSRRLALDTEQTHVEGRGSINLRDERIDLLLTPEPKDPGLFTRRASIRINGALQAPALSMEDRVEQAPGGKGPC